MTDPTTTFAILLGGTLEVNERVRGLAAGARVIAADSGIRHAAALGVMPELWVGDFDSIGAEDRAAWAEVPQEEFPAAKNATDGEIAIDAAIARGARRLVLFGALAGERTDHAGLHFLQALALGLRGFDVVLSSGEEEAVPILPGRRVIELDKGALFSVLPFSDLRSITLQGVRYPLDRADIAFGSSRTLSNSAEGPVTVELAGGMGLFIARPQDFSGA